MVFFDFEEPPEKHPNYLLADAFQRRFVARYEDLSNRSSLTKLVLRPAFSKSIYRHLVPNEM
jgi:hypothetical protein